MPRDHAAACQGAQVLAHRVIAGAVLILIAGAARAQSIAVGPAVTISPAGSGVHFWWTTAASTTDPRRLIACALRTRERTATVQAVLYGSPDGGASWRTLRADSTTNFVSEVSCAAGAEGTVYFVNSPTGAGFQEPDIDWGMLLERSTDFGSQWHTAPRAAKYMDAAAVAIRPGTDPAGDSLYIFADDGRGALALTSVDGGRTLGSGRPVPLPGGSYGIMDGAAALPDGSVGGLYFTDPVTSQYQVGSPPRPRALLFRLGQSGKPLGEPIPIATLNTDLTKFGTFPWAGSEQDLNGSIAAGPVQPHGPRRVYVAWNTVVDGREHIVLATSDDSGVSWSSARVADDMPAVSNGSRDTSAAMASLAVNREGVLGLQWAEFAGRCWRFAASLDGGVTFLPSVPLNVCPRRDLVGTQQFRSYMRSNAWYDSTAGPHVRVDIVPWHVEIQQRGTGLAATADGVFHPVWVVRGDGEAQLQTARVAVASSPASAAAVGRSTDGGTTPMPIDVTGGVAERDATVDFASGVAYDEGTGEFSLTAVVVRHGAANLHWPAVMRVKSLSSPLGAVAVVGADNHLTGEGATWTIDGPARSLPAGSMADLDQRTPALHQPWTFSRPREIRVRLTGVPPVTPPAHEQHLLTLDVEILTVPQQ